MKQRVSYKEMMKNNKLARWNEDGKEEELEMDGPDRDRTDTNSKE